MTTTVHFRAPCARYARSGLLFKTITVTRIADSAEIVTRYLDGGSAISGEFATGGVGHRMR